METTQKIFIGYRTKPVSYLNALLPVVAATAEAPEQAANTKRADALTTAALGGDRVYLSTFDEVHILIPSKKKAVTYKSEGREPGGAKPPICLAVRAFILKFFPNAWHNDTNHDGKRPEAIFMGFDPRFFLKLLGLECSLPLFGQPLPAGMWFGNSEHRDITEAVLPKTESKGLDWELLIRARRLGLKDESLSRYDQIFQGWPGPGTHPEQDAIIAMTLASQLGFLSKE
jgi:hypothetical protein